MIVVDVAPGENPPPIATDWSTPVETGNFVAKNHIGKGIALGTEERCQVIFLQGIGLL